jgi:hypothetical protein
MGCAWRSITIGVLSSLVATFVWAFIAAKARESRARSFVGEYLMHGPPPETEPLNITVRIEYGSFWRNCWRNLIGQALALEIFAEHGKLGSAPAPGTEEWSGLVDVLGPSPVASGSFRYRDREGGILRLVLTDDPDVITEHAIPYDPGHKAFVRTLKRIKVQKVEVTRG